MPETKKAPTVEIQSVAGSRHRAIDSDFVGLDPTGDDGSATREDAPPTRGETGAPSSDDEGSVRPDEVVKPLDVTYRSGRIDPDRDPDLETSDDDIAQDPMDGTLPRD